MKHATMNDLKAVMDVFNKYKDIFHVTEVFVKIQIEKGAVIYEDGVVIIYGFFYEMTALGSALAFSNDAYISHIADTEPGSGNAAKVIRRLFKELFDRDIYITVRSDNRRAIAFYKKLRLQLVGRLEWSIDGVRRGGLPGEVYKRERKV